MKRTIRAWGTGIANYMVRIVLGLKFFFQYMMPFIESNILMSLFRIVRLLLLFRLDLCEDQRRAKRPFVEARKQ
jgi:hypothetical protein